MIKLRMSMDCTEGTIIWVNCSFGITLHTRQHKDIEAAILIDRYVAKYELAEDREES